MANESGLYIGAEVGSTKEKDIESGISIHNTSTSWAVNAGYYLDQNNRAYAAYQYISKGDYAARTDVYSAGYDYLFGTSSLKPFVGVVLAYSTFKNGNFNPKGMAYGAQAGIDYALNKQFSVDAGYRYLNSNAKDSNYNGETKSYQTAFVGANYKF